MTERMQAIAEAVDRWGTHAAAARNLGISTGTVTATMQRVEIQRLRERVGDLEAALTIIAEPGSPDGGAAIAIARRDIARMALRAPQATDGEPSVNP